MSLHDKLINKLKELYPDISKTELEKIVDSEFRLIEKTIKDKQCKNINCIYLGKFYPTTYRRMLERKKNEQA